MKTPTAAALLACVVAGTAATAAAFDTGHHFDSTRDGLFLEGFSEDAVRAVQLYNWMTDFTASDFLSDERLYMKRAHFDNMPNSEMLLADFARLATGTRTAIEEAAADGDATGVLAVLGVSLHTVQDFYSHSTWAERFTERQNDTDAAQCYATVPSVPADVLEAQDLFSGYTDADVSDAIRNATAERAEAAAAGEVEAQAEHGSYRCGMNKDSYTKGFWRHSRRYAVFATREWARQAAVWVEAVSPAVWAAAKEWTPADDDEEDALAFGLRGARDMSMWTKLPATNRQDGHWKGPGSGSVDEFAAAIAVFVANRDFQDSDFLGQLKTKRRHRAVFGELMEGLAAPDNAAEVASLPQTLHEVTVQVHELALVRGTADLANEPDMFARVTIAGHVYEDAVLQDNTVRTASAPLVAVVSGETAPAAPIAIRIEVFDEDLGSDSFAGDEALDVNPSSSSRVIDLEYSLVTGELSGDLEGSASSRTSVGDGSLAARVVFSVSHTTVTACGVDEAVAFQDFYTACSSAPPRAAPAAAALLAVVVLLALVF